MAILSASHLAPAAGAFEPQRISNWSFEVALDAAGDQLLIMQSLEAFDLPSEESDEIALNYANESRYVAGKTKYPDAMLQLKDFVDPNVAEAVWKWRREVYNPDTGSVGLARNYKKNADLTLYAPDQSIIRVYKCIGCWPKAVKSARLDMNNSDKLLLDVTIRMDRFTLGAGFTSAVAGVNVGNANAPI